jgi:hypothetical protein
VDEVALNGAVGPVGWRSIGEGVRDTIGTLKMAIQRGTLDVDAVRARLREETKAARALT